MAEWMRSRMVHFLSWASSKYLNNLCCPQRPCWCLWSMLLSKTMLMPMVHVNVCGLCYHRRPCWHLWSMLLLEAMWMSVFLGPWWFVWSMPSLEDMLVSVVCAATWDHFNVLLLEDKWMSEAWPATWGYADVYGTIYCCRRPYGSQWLVLQLKTMLMYMVCVVTKCHDAVNWPFHN